MSSCSYCLALGADACPYQAAVDEAKKRQRDSYLSQRILVDAAFAAAVEEDGFVTAYPPVTK